MPPPGSVLPGGGSYHTRKSSGQQCPARDSLQRHALDVLCQGLFRFGPMTAQTRCPKALGCMRGPVNFGQDRYGPTGPNIDREVLIPNTGVSASAKRGRGHGPQIFGHVQKDRLYRSLSASNTRAHQTGRGGKSPNPDVEERGQARGRTADGCARSRGTSLPPHCRNIRRTTWRWDMIRR